MATGLTAVQRKELNNGEYPKQPVIPMALVLNGFNHEQVVTDDIDDSAATELDLSDKDASLNQKCIVASGSDNFEIDFVLPEKQAVIVLTVDTDTNNINKTMTIAATDKAGNAVDVRTPSGTITSPNSNICTYIFWWNGTTLDMLLQLVALTAL